MHPTRLHSHLSITCCTAATTRVGCADRPATLGHSTAHAPRSAAASHQLVPTSAAKPAQSVRRRERHSLPRTSWRRLTSAAEIAPADVTYASAVRHRITWGYGCADALAYLRTHAAPGFTFECPGYAFGHQAMTCYNNPPYCPEGVRIIAIAVPCAAAYMNEASNSWVLLGRRQAPIDPYGYCT